MAEARVQRRLAAILAADMVGYSRLMGADEEGTISRQKAHRAELIDPVITSHGGRIVKTMGDGLLVEFPSVVDAVKCAVEVQRAMSEREANVPEDRRIQYRIGINLGDIVIDGDDILGDGVNVAARLEGEANAGGICISAKVFEEIGNKLDVEFEDLGPLQVKNITEPVRAYRAVPERVPSVSSVAPPPLPEKLSIAVLPFDNMSGDPEQEYFADGIAEDIITDLSKLSALFVTARNSSFQYKGQTVDVKRVGNELSVKHILEGSVRKMGSKLRINAQLIDAASGGHLWAERYDGDMEDIFQFQDDIREQIVAALKLKLTPTDKALTERDPTDSVEAYDLFLKGRANFHRYTPEGLQKAMKCFEEAIEIDRNFADAYGYLAYCHIWGWAMRFPGFDDGLDQAHEMAERGVALDGTSAIAIMRLGWIQGFLRRYDQAITNLEKAIAMAPNNAEVYASFGNILNYWGDPERGLQMLEKAFSLEAFVPPIWEYYAGHSNYLLHQYDEAITRFQYMIERSPQFTYAYLWMACSYVELDRLDDARGAIKAFLEILPQYTIKDADGFFPIRIDEVRERFRDSLRTAGLPEG
jgi:TolB-like protein/Tfp pilus assembly protein PilF